MVAKVCSRSQAQPPSGSRSRAMIAIRRARGSASAGGGAGMREGLGVDHVDWSAGREGGDLLEDVGELQFILVARHIADVRRGDDVRQGEERVVWVAHGLFLEHID